MRQFSILLCAPLFFELDFGNRKTKKEQKTDFIGPVQCLCNDYLCEKRI